MIGIDEKAVDEDQGVVGVLGSASKMAGFGFGAETDSTSIVEEVPRAAGRVHEYLTRTSSDTVRIPASLS